MIRQIAAWVGNSFSSMKFLIAYHRTENVSSFFSQEVSKSWNYLHFIWILFSDYFRSRVFPWVIRLTISQPFSAFITVGRFILFSLFARTYFYVIVSFFVQFCLFFFLSIFNQFTGLHSGIVCWMWPLDPIIGFSFFAKRMIFKTLVVQFMSTEVSLYSGYIIRYTLLCYNVYDSISCILYCTVILCHL